MHCQMLKTLAFCPSPHARTRPPVHRAPFAYRPRTPRSSPFLARFPSAESRTKTRTKSVDFAKGSLMPEVIFTGPAGRLEGRYHPAKQKNAPIAMVLTSVSRHDESSNHLPVLLRVCASRIFGAAVQFPRC